MNTRLKQFIAAENITQSQFAEKIQVVRASVSHVLSGRNNPGYEFIKAIMLAYPKLSMEWLILGKGRMYKESNPEQHTAIQEPDLYPISNEPELFNDAAYSDAVVPEIPEYPQDPEPPILHEMQTINLNKPTQSIVRQRKVVKVTIFFDDGTYQEM